MTQLSSRSPKYVPDVSLRNRAVQKKTKMASQIEVQDAHPDVSSLKAFHETRGPVSSESQIEFSQHSRRSSEVDGGPITHHGTNSHELPTSRPDPPIQSPSVERYLRKPTSMETFRTNSGTEPLGSHLRLASTNTSVSNLHPPAEAAKRLPTEQATVAAPNMFQEHETIIRRGRIQSILGRVEWKRILEGTIEEVESFTNLPNAETKYQEFKSFMLQEGRGLDLPHGCKPYDRVLLRSEEPDSQPFPCIRFTGFPSRELVKKYHAVLTKNRLRRVYSPPLRLCYEIRKIRLLAGPSQTLSIGSPGKGSLCGSLALIDDGENSRTVTIGGMLKTEDGYAIITAGHLDSNDDNKSIDEDSSVSSFESSLDPDDYANDISPPLILGDPADDLSVEDLEDDPQLHHSIQSSVSVGETFTQPSKSSSMLQTVAQPLTPTTTFTLGEVKNSGSDWSLVSISDPALALPNSFCLEDSTRPIYLTRMIHRPGTGRVWLLAGVSGQRSVAMTPGETQLPLPSGAWISAWKGQLDNGLCE